MTADAVGGVWDYSLELARGLTTRGLAVTLATMGPLPSVDQRRAATAVDGLDLVVRDYRLEWMERPWRDVEAAGDWLLDLAERCGADLVHLNGYAHGHLNWRVPTVVVGHSCVCSWWQAVHGCMPPPSWDEYRARVRRGLERADAVVTPTHSMLAALRAHYGPVDGVVIPNGRDGRTYLPASKVPLVFAAGRLWDEAKNLQQLVSVAADVRWPVYIAGDPAPPGDAGYVGQGFSPATYVGQGFGPAAYVGQGFSPARCLGRLPAAALRQWLARAALYVLPARYEPFGLSVLEAALSGCALVLGDIASLRENWDGAAMFVPPGDRGALASGLRSLIGDAAARDTLVRRARERAADLSADATTDAYLELYTALGSSMEDASCASFCSATR